MKDNIQIIPAILATSEKDYAEKLKRIESCVEFTEGWVQIDLMDSMFVQNKSISPEIIAKYPTKLKLEAQLMVEYPENWIDELIKIGVDRIVFPIEDLEGITERVDHIKNHGIQVGISLNPETKVAKVLPFVSTIDLILIMSVQPGFGGQEFIKNSIEKVRKLAEIKQSSNFVIEVDGGIDDTVVKELVSAGADNLVMGSHLLDGDITENLEKIWEELYPYTHP